MSATVQREQRFHSTRNPCPICGGGDDLPRGHGTRCNGFLSTDGKWAHCAREEYAGGLPLEEKSGTYAHRLEGSCRCGAAHGPAPSSPTRTPSRSATRPPPPRILSDQHFNDCEAGSPWDYLDETGAVRYRKARHAGKRFAFYHRNGTGEWTDGRGTSPVLLDLPLVREAIAKNRTVVLAEGEKKARALQALGFAATTNDAGALGFAREDVERLRGAPRVVIVLDNDEDGMKRGERIPPMLHAVGVRDVRVLLIPELAEGEGVDDWIARRQDKRAEMVRELEALMRALPPWQPPATGNDGRRASGASPWDAAQDVHDFVSATEPEADFLVPGLIARGVVTAWFSPRGLGKTLVAHHLAVMVARQGSRVLLIDRDNPRREVRRRLRAWGLGQVERERLRIISRDAAPPLTDAKAWAAFPVGAYDLVVLDSLDAATEGVGEQDSGKPALAVASLLDTVRAANGPGCLILGNTIKSGSHGRGSGVIEDRLDIVFEVRDCTGFKPTGTRAWWQELPASGRDAWADRAARRKHRDTYRLAFVPSKYRIGEEPDPFVFEVCCKGEPWTCSEVTADLVQEGEQSRQQVEHEKVAQLDTAARALAAEVVRLNAAGASMPRRDGAEPFLVGLGLARRAAREMIAGRDGKDWRLAGSGRRGDPEVLLPLGAGQSGEEAAGIQGQGRSLHQRSEVIPIPAAQEPCGRPESTTTTPALAAVRTGHAFRPPTSPIAGDRETVQSLVDAAVGEVEP